MCVFENIRRLMEKSQYALILCKFSPGYCYRHLIMFLTSEKSENIAYFQLTSALCCLPAHDHHLISPISVRNQKMGSRTACQRIVHYQDSFLLLRVCICLTVFQVTNECNKRVPSWGKIRWRNVSSEKIIIRGKYSAPSQNSGTFPR